MFSAFSGWTEVRGCEGASLIERRHAAATVQHIHVFVWRVRTYTHGCSSSDQKVRSASSAAAAAAFQSASAPSTAWPFAPYFRSSSTTCCPAGPALSANAHPDCPPSVSRPASHLRSAVHWVEGCTQLAAKRGGEEGGAGRAVLAPEAGRKLQSKGQVEAMVWGLKGWGGGSEATGECDGGGGGASIPCKANPCKAVLASYADIRHGKAMAGKATAYAVPASCTSVGLQEGSALFGSDPAFSKALAQSTCPPAQAWWNAV